MSWRWSNYVQVTVKYRTQTNPVCYLVWVTVMCRHLVSSKIHNTNTFTWQPLSRLLSCALEKQFGMALVPFDNCLGALFLTTILKPKWPSDNSLGWIFQPLFYISETWLIPSEIWYSQNVENFWVSSEI